MRRLEHTAKRDIPIISDLGFSRAVLGRLSANRIRLRYRRPFVHNSFAPVFVGALQATSSGTRIEGQFRMHRFVRIFLGVWFGFVLIVGSVLFVASLATAFGLTGRQTEGDWWIGFVVGPGLLVFGVVLVRFGKYLGETDRREILAFLRDVLYATEIPDHAA